MQRPLIYKPALLALFLMAALSACSAVVINNESPPEAQYADGERLLNKERFLEAVERFRMLKSRYPYSKYAALASLRIADCHFAEEAYIEAAAAYKVFRELYPKHEHAAYAQFRTAESYYNQLPGAVDRDLEPAKDAIQAYSDYLKLFPSHPEAAKAQFRITELRQTLAEKEDYVGNFYFIRDFYLSAAGRYRHILENYPEAGLNEKALYRLAYSYEKVGEYAKAEEAIERLKLEFPKGSFISSAAAIQKRIEAAKQQQ